MAHPFVLFPSILRRSVLAVIVLNGLDSPRALALAEGQHLHPVASGRPAKLKTYRGMVLVTMISNSGEMQPTHIT